MLEVPGSWGGRKGMKSLVGGKVSALSLRTRRVHVSLLSDNSGFSLQT